MWDRMRQIHDDYQHKIKSSKQGYAIDAFAFIVIIYFLQECVQVVNIYPVPLCSFISVKPSHLLGLVVL